MTHDDVLGLVVQTGCTILFVGAAWLVLSALWVIWEDLRKKG